MNELKKKPKKQQQPCSLQLLFYQTSPIKTPVCANALVFLKVN